MTPGIDYTGITVVYLCHDGKGHILLNKRSEKCRDEHHRWDPGGGKLEFGSTIEDTLKREIKEEYCADVLDFQFLGYQDVHRVHEGKKTHWIAMHFLVHVDPDTVANGEPEKFEAIGWFTLDTLPSPLHSQLPAFLEKYQQVLSDSLFSD